MGIFHSKIYPENKEIKQTIKIFKLLDYTDSDYLCVICNEKSHAINLGNYEVLISDFVVGNNEMHNHPQNNYTIKLKCSNNHITEQKIKFNCECGWSN